jgi:hypothetical protein
MKKKTIKNKKTNKSKKTKKSKKNSRKNYRGGLEPTPTTEVINKPYSYTILSEDNVNTEQVRGFYSGTWNSARDLPYLNGTMTIINNDNIPIRRYRGDWLHGKPFGNGIMQYGNGDKFEGNFQNGRLDGEGTFTMANGDKYVGNFSNDKTNGYGEYISANGDTYKGQWKEGSKFGIGTYTSSSREYIGIWKDNAPSGDGKMTFFKSGVIIKGIFKYETQTDGESIFYIRDAIALYPDGSKFEGDFADYEKISGNVSFVPPGITNPDAGNPNFDIRNGI